MAPQAWHLGLCGPLPSLRIIFSNLPQAQTHTGLIPPTPPSTPPSSDISPSNHSLEYQFPILAFKATGPQALAGLSSLKSWPTQPHPAGLPESCRV